MECYWEDHARQRCYETNTRYLRRRWHEDIARERAWAWEQEQDVGPFIRGALVTAAVMWAGAVLYLLCFCTNWSIDNCSFSPFG